MGEQHTIRLTSSLGMVLVLFGRISAALLPTVEETGKEASLDIEHGDDNLSSLIVTVPYHTWAALLLEGIARAIFERQEIVYVSGWDDLCDKLLRIPWFRTVSTNLAETASPTVFQSGTEKLSEVGRLAEVNQFLCSWIFVSNVMDAINIEFGNEDGHQSNEFRMIHPAVVDELPYLIYSQVLTAWCETIRLPRYLVAGAETMMRDNWRPAMASWLLSLRPDVKCEVIETDGQYACRITGSGSSIALLKRALLCLGNLVVAQAQEFLTVLRVTPHTADKVSLSPRDPIPTTHTIFAATLEDLGFKKRPTLDLLEEPRLIFNSYGQPYMTVGAFTPIDEVLVEWLINSYGQQYWIIGASPPVDETYVGYLRTVAQGAHDHAVARHYAAR